MLTILPQVVLCPIDYGVMLVQRDQLRRINANINELFNFAALSKLFSIGAVVSGPGLNVREHVFLQIH